MVSVIIPVFNGASYIEETVYSVENSSYKRFEILLIDDGSSDRSQLICQGLEKKYKNVRFYSFPKNKGLGRVLNFALNRAKGKYICRINQDDRMLMYRIKTQVNFLEKNNNISAVGSYIKLFRKSKNTKFEVIKFLETDEEIKKLWLIVSPFSDPSVMYRKTTALKVGGYEQEFWPADDSQLWYKIGKAGKLANITKPLVEVRYHNEAASLKYFRQLTIKTYKMHMWANKNIQKATVAIRLFWIFQLISGLILPAKFNWSIYRLIKKIINYSFTLKRFLMIILEKIRRVIKLIPHPKRLSLSGT